MTDVSIGPWMGLRAALLLARGRPEGAFLVSIEPPEAQLARARHSFLAMLFCVPIFLLIQSLGQDQGKASLGISGPGIATLRESAAFVLAWLGYAVLSHRLATAMDRAELWPLFVVLWNWCNLVQYLLMACALTPALFGAPPIIGQTGWVVAMGWSLWLQWSATRFGLGLPGGRAAMLVAADMALGMVVLRLTAS